MSLHTWHHHSPRKPSSCATSRSTLTGAELLQAKKSFIYVSRVALVVSNSLRPCRLWPARLLCQGDSLGKNTGAYWPILVAIPFESAIFLLP